MNREFIIRYSYPSMDELTKVPSKERGGFFSPEMHAEFDEMRKYFNSWEWKRKTLQREDNLINNREYNWLNEIDREMRYPQGTMAGQFKKNIVPELQFEPKYRYTLQDGNVDSSILK